jgi:hypothetical protein
VAEAAAVFKTAFMVSSWQMKVPTTRGVCR